ncbi:MAG: hypothetical protein RSA27_02295, partial [Oscillospiraceae bacterium]
MFEAVYGPGGTDKIEYIYSCIRENMKNDVFSYILVPEQFSLYMEKDILSKLGVTAQTSVKVFTFSRLCNMVFGEVGPLRMRYIDSAGKLILAKRAMQMLENDLDYLKSNVHQSGFAQVIVDIIGSFKRYGVTSEGIKLVLEKIESQELKRKLIDINLIFEKFQELLEEKNSDADDNLALAYPKISRCKNIVGKLYIHEFRSFTPNEYKAIAELMLKLDVCIALCTDDLNAEAGIFSPVSDTYRDLKLKAKENDIAVKAPVCLTREVKFEKAPALKHLKDNFFAIPPNVYSEKQSEVHICTPRNYYQEVEMTARLILKLCRTEGYRYSDFLILSGNDEKYNKIIPAVFRQNNINVFLDSKRNINSNPIVRMITAMLEILAYGYSYERVMAIAGSGLLPEDISRGEVDVFENYLLATEPSHKMWNEDEWNFNPHMAYDMESINRVRTRLLLPISDAQNSISGTKTFGEICDLVTMWLDDINLVKCIKEKCEYFDKNNFPELSEEYRQVWNAVLTVLAQLKGLMNDEKITYKKFAELFATACGGVEVGMVPQTIDRVIY